ncbi:MAG: glutathione S-transferase family protein [Polyangiales bacterium]
MSKLVLYSARACPYAHRTRLVLSEKKLPFKLEEIDLQNKPAWFDAKVSAYGKVPALDHDGVRLWESAIVNEYLDEVFPEPALLPKDPAQRAHARIWIDYANTRFTSAFGGLLRGQDEAERARAKVSLRESLTFIEREALLKSEGPFFLGKAPSLVDFAFYPWFERWPALAHFRDFPLPTELTRLSQWLDALRGLDAVREHQNTPDYYIERYAKHVAPKAQVA